MPFRPSPGDARWEELARRNPYFAVVTREEFRGAALDEHRRGEFYASGEVYVDHLFALLQRYLGWREVPRSALDFGCGVGRVTLALARRCARVVGADVSQAMLAVAKREVESSGCANVALVHLVGDDVGALEPVDFVHSVLVFQHIPPRRGRRLLASLCALLRPGGSAALHFTTATADSRRHRAVTALRDRMPALHRYLNRREGRSPDEPLMRMYTYRAERLRAVIEASGCRLVRAEPWDQPEHPGHLLILRR